MQVHLVDSATLETISLPRIPAIVGRDAEADMRLADALVAPFHCMLGQRDGHVLNVWSLRDEACTRINGQPVTNAQVFPGDRLTVGNSEFIVDYELARPRRTPEASRLHC